eukprot:m.46306 g.46306  ORF g.46306 m.46306 type:complete len:411 (-) comp13137_c0_seq1:34-1266(-)
MSSKGLCQLIFGLQLQAAVANGFIIVDWAEEIWQRVQDDTWVLVVFIGCCIVLIDIIVVLICICRYRCKCNREKIQSDLQTNNVELRQVKRTRRVSQDYRKSVASFLYDTEMDAPTEAERTIALHIHRSAREPLGIVLEPVRQAASVIPSPMLVAEVAEHSPADRAGIHPGDVIRVVNERSMTGYDKDEVEEALLASTDIDLEVLRPPDTASSAGAAVTTFNRTVLTLDPTPADEYLRSSIDFQHNPGFQAITPNATPHSTVSTSPIIETLAGPILSTPHLAPPSHPPPSQPPPSHPPAPSRVARTPPGVPIIGIPAPPPVPPPDSLDGSRRGSTASQAAASVAATFKRRPTVRRGSSAFQDSGQELELEDRMDSLFDVNDLPPPPAMLLGMGTQFSLGAPDQAEADSMC